MAWLSLTGFAAWPARAAEDCSTLRLGLPAGNDAAGRDLGAIQAYLSQAEPDLRVVVSTESSVDALRHAIGRGILDASWLTADSYVAAHDTGVTAILKAMRNGRAGYWSAFIVRADSRYKKIADLKGATFAWTDATSAAGYEFPRATLLRLGFNPDAFFARQSFAGGHDAAVLAVLNGAVDAAATFAFNTRGTNGAWSRLLDPAQVQQIRVIGYSRQIPSDPIAVRQSYLERCPAAVERIKNALSATRYYPAAARALNSILGIDALAPAQDSDYDALRETRRLLGRP